MACSQRYKLTATSSRRPSEARAGDFAARHGCGRHLAFRGAAACRRRMDRGAPSCLRPRRCRHPAAGGVHPATAGTPAASGEEGSGGRAPRLERRTTLPPRAPAGQRRSSGVVAQFRIGGRRRCMGSGGEGACGWHRLRASTIGIVIQPTAQAGARPVPHAAAAVARGRGARRFAGPWILAAGLDGRSLRRPRQSR